MKTESRWRNEYISSSSDPIRLSHQNAVGTTTRRRFSVAYHWTKKREKKTRLPSQPTTFHTLQSMPSSLPLGHRRPLDHSITGAAYGRIASRENTKGRRRDYTALPNIACSTL